MTFVKLFSAALLIVGITSSTTRAEQVESAGSIPEVVNKTAEHKAALIETTGVETDSERIQTAARRLLGDRYAGLHSREGRYVVSVVGLETKNVERLGVVTKQVAFSEVQLQSAFDQIVANMESMIKEGVDISTIAVDHELNAIVVTLFKSGANERTAELESSFRPLANGVPIVYEQGSLVQLAGRQDDWAPHWGGARITGSNGRACTSGSAWVPSGQSWKMLTAAHCGDTTVSYASGPHYFGATVWTGGAIPVSTDRLDVASIQTDGLEGYFYVGDILSEGGVGVAGYYTGVQTGLTGLRVSGATSGETYVAPGAVVQTNIAVNNGTSVYYHQNSFDCFIQAGDSGAPVFRIVNGQIHFAGILSGRNSQTGICYYTPTNMISQFYPGVAGGA